MLESAVVATDANKCSNLSVLVNNAYDGVVVSGATVLIGSVSQTTDSTGRAKFTNLPKGAASVGITATNFRPSAPRSLTLNCGDQETSVSLSPTEGTGALTANQVRVILNWGSTPYDLDAHLTGPFPGLASSSYNETGRFHTYWYHKTGNSDGVAVLDVDDRTSYGPETITISPPSGQSTLRAGIYRYSVHHFSGSGTLSDGTTVELIVGSESRTFRAPVGAGGSKSVWTVFELNVDQTGSISVLPVNTYGSNSNEDTLRSARTVPPQQEPSFLFSNNTK